MQRTERCRPAPVSFNFADLQRTGRQNTFMIGNSRVGQEDQGPARSRNRKVEALTKRPWSSSPSSWPFRGLPAFFDEDRFPMNIKEYKNGAGQPTDLAKVISQPYIRTQCKFCCRCYRCCGYRCSYYCCCGGCSGGCYGSCCDCCSGGWLSSCSGGCLGGRRRLW